MRLFSGSSLRRKALIYSRQVANADVISCARFFLVQQRAITAGMVTLILSVAGKQGDIPDR